MEYGNPFLEGHEQWDIFSAEIIHLSHNKMPHKDHLVPCNLKGTCIESRGYSIWNIDKNGDLLLVNNSSGNAPDDIYWHNSG